ncbi:Na(+)/H(+) antiporter NhaA [Candidatus Nitrospira nitrosa]|uniref:Na(+)/H(+) antiporter NhaA n=1 Tax=Candidatus Nitrospira nitrosa TaxID=1742972 RepID=A0A0S4L6M2_9BACT|nr:Na+/H+ antiporter NhaA [Candidatus Nitrospira nitrosa]CUS31428.1 Na(+)/H(+) antiporter NhaA [Candidatus Nitrospira nitrosa]
MSLIQQRLSNTFTAFVDSEKASGVVLMGCTVLSLGLANSSIGTSYSALWQSSIGGASLEHWINDGLMTIFFLLIGLELERELYNGELAQLKNALLPICAAIGGMITPALIHLGINGGTPTQPGVGIPMATDIAFALGVLAILGDRVPASLKVFVVAFAIMDDLGAVVVIAAFYTTHLSIWHLACAAGVWMLLAMLNHAFRVMSLVPYLFGGLLLWWLILQSGVHATIAGVALAFAIPFTAREEDEASPSHRLERFLHKPVAFIVLPIFALANTGIAVGADWLENLTSPNSVGIIAGLTLGKPVGVIMLCAVAVASGLCRLPEDLTWHEIAGAGILGGIGFTMSIFIANLAFPGNPDTTNASKLAILLASLIAGTTGFLWLRVFGKPRQTDGQTVQ